MNALKLAPQYTGTRARFIDYAIADLDEEEEKRIQHIHRVQMKQAFVFAMYNIGNNKDIMTTFGTQITKTALNLIFFSLSATPEKLIAKNLAARPTISSPYCRQKTVLAFIYVKITSRRV